MVDEFESFTTVTYDPCTHVCPVHGKTIPCTFNVNDPATIVYGPFCANCIGEFLVKTFEIVRPIKESQ